MKILIFLLCLCSSVLAAPDQSCLQGKVTEKETGIPIPGATIRLEPDEGAISDINGDYFIKTDQVGLCQLQISHMSYGNSRRQIRLITGDTVVVDFQMEISATEIGGFRILVNQSDNPSFDAPQPISIVDETEFSERSFSSTAEVLREEPGVLVQKTTHGHGSPIIRGLIGKHVLLLYNGIRLNRPTFRFGANQYLNSFDQSWLSGAAVLRGPVSVIYGSDALGGAINLIPYAPPFSTDQTRFASRLSSRYSSADKGYALNTRLSLTAKKWVAWSGMSWKSIDDLRGGGNIGVQHPTGWNQFDFTGSLSRMVGQNIISLTYLGSRGIEIPRYDKYVSGDFERFTYDPQNRDMIVMTIQNLTGSDSRTSSRLSLSYSNEDEGRQEQKTGADEIESSRQVTTTWGGVGQLAFIPTNNHRLTLGTEYYFDKLTGWRKLIRPTSDTLIRPTYPDGSTYHAFGFFGEHSWSISSDWELTSGLRYSNISYSTELEHPYGTHTASFWNVTGAISSSYLISDCTRLIARWSRGFRAPNLNDIAVLKTSSSGVDVPSPGLLPENSDNFELGIRHHDPNQSGSLCLFYNSLTELIDRRPGLYDGLSFIDDNQNSIQDEGEFDVFQRFNMGRGQIYGIELDGYTSLSETLSLRGNIFAIRGDNLTDDEPLSRIPPLMGLIGVRHDFSDTKWIEFVVRAAGSQRRLSQRDIEDSRIAPGGTPGWITIGLRGGMNIYGAELTIRMNNLTNKAYKEHGSGIYSPGRSIELGLLIRN